MFPPKSDQKPGDIPLGECVNDTTMPTPFGPGCWQVFFLPEDEPAHDEVESTPDSLDSRMQQTWYVNGTLWGSSGTAVRVNGELKAGIAWFAVSPKINGAGKIEGQVKKQGYVALADNNLTMPGHRPDPGRQGCDRLHGPRRDQLPERRLRPDRRERLGRADPHRRRGPRAARRLHQLQGVRR